MGKQERVCGSCTACCKTHPVFELFKLWNAWCTECQVGRGCRIYSNRPKGCQDFQCQWLMGWGKDDERPDRTKLVPDFIELGELGLTLMLHEVTEGSLLNGFARRCW